MSTFQSRTAAEIRRSIDRLTSLERELADVRSTLLAAETLLVGITAPPSVNPDAYTTTEVADALGLSRSTIAAMLARGEIRSVKLGGARRVFRADLDAYISAVRGGAA